MTSWRVFKFNIPDWSQRVDVLHSKLEPLLVELETNGLIAGYNYNFYGPVDAHIVLRVEPAGEDALSFLRAKLGGLDMGLTEGNYDEPGSVKKAYELGSQWASLFWELVQHGRMRSEQTADVNLRRLALHGLFNSMGFGYDDEALSYCVGLCGLAAQGAIGNPEIRMVAEGVLKMCEGTGLLQRRT